MNAANAVELPAIPARTDADRVYAYEYPWSTSGKAGALGKFAGMAVLSPDAPTRQIGLTRLSTARPIGVARLVLARRFNQVKQAPVDVFQDPPEEWLLYASPLMRMYENDAYQNYSISRYLWSLRGLPGAEHIQAIWMISTPRSELADAMAFGMGPSGNRVEVTRYTTLKEMVADAAARKSTWNLDITGNNPLPVQKCVLGIIDLTSEPDGSVSILDAAKSDYKTAGFATVTRDTTSNTQAGAYALGHLPWGKAKTYAASIDLSTFSDLPDYFKDVS